MKRFFCIFLIFTLIASAASAMADGEGMLTELRAMYTAACLQQGTAGRELSGRVEDYEDGSYAVILQDPHDPMSGWDFRSDLEIQVIGGEVSVIRGIGPLATVADDPDDYAFLMLCSSAVGAYSGGDASAVSSWVTQQALPFFISGWQSGSCPEFSAGRLTLYADVMYGDCEMPWSITAY